MKEKPKCEAEINYSSSSQILTKVINGYDRELCGCNAKYFENGLWYCGKHSPIKVAEREDKRYKNWLNKKNATKK